MAIDWSRYLVDTSAEEGEVAEETGEVAEETGQAAEDIQLDPQDQQPIDWNKYAVTKEEKPDPDPFTAKVAKETARYISRSGVRAGETIVGTPGNMIQFVENSAKWLDSKLPNVPKWLDKKPNELQKGIRKLLQNIPTVDKVKEEVKDLTSGYFEPHNSFEKHSDDVWELATTFAIGKGASGSKNLLGKVGNFILNTVKKIPSAFAVKSSGKTAKALGAGPKTQAAVELGTLAITALRGKDVAKEAVNAQYGRRDALAPPGVIVNSNRVNKDLVNLERELAKGVSTPTKAPVLGKLSELKAKTSTGAIELEELTQASKDITENMTSKSLFGDLSRTGQKILKRRYGQLKNIVDEEIEQYGKTNPKWFDAHQKANKAHAAVEQSRFISNFVNKNIGKIGAAGAGGSFLAKLFNPSLLKEIPGLGVKGTVAFSAIKSGEVLYQITRSPVLAKAYMNFLGAAASENVPLLVKYGNELETGLKILF